MKQFQIVLKQKQLVEDMDLMCFLANEFMDAFQEHLADSYDAEFMLVDVVEDTEELDKMWTEVKSNGKM